MEKVGKDGNSTLLQVSKIGEKGESFVHLSHLKIKVVKVPSFAKVFSFKYFRMGLLLMAHLADHMFPDSS
jgi:hypothetical protein